MALGSRIVATPRDHLVPDQATILGWIEEVFARGVRRPGYPADRWAERHAAERFRALGLENVRLEAVTLPYWEPRAWSLRVRTGGAEREVPCFPLPFSAPTDGIEGELIAFSADAPERVAGRVSLWDAPLLRVPPALAVFGGAAPGPQGRTLEPKERVFDRRLSFGDALQVLPFSAAIMDVMEPSIEAGAVAFVGTLSGYPGDSHAYYVPYDGVARSIPGVWVSGSEGERLRAELSEGPVQVHLAVDAERSESECFNVVGELPGADDESVVIGSHHDGPWSSAVEDGSGIALVLAQATYWAQVPAAERPHRLVFLLNAGHMAGGAGCAAFLEQHAAELDRIVLELHLEHAAREISERGGGLAPTGLPEPRWWFTSRIPALERAVADAIVAEGLDRSLILPPDALGPHPTTDGGFFHTRGVPLVNFLTAPFYLFDEMDRMDKIHAESLEPVTRAAIRILESTRGVSAAAMRARIVEVEGA